LRALKRPFTYTRQQIKDGERPLYASKSYAFLGPLGCILEVILLDLNRKQRL